LNWKHISQKASSIAEIPVKVSQLMFGRLKSRNNIILVDGWNWDKWWERDSICDSVGSGGRYTMQIIVEWGSSALTLKHLDVCGGEENFTNNIVLYCKKNSPTPRATIITVYFKNSVREPSLSNCYYVKIVGVDKRLKLR